MYVRRAGGCVTRSTHCVADDASITSSNFGRVSIRAYNSKSNTNRFAVCKLPFARRPALRVGGPRKRGSPNGSAPTPTSPDANESREPCNAAVRRDTHTQRRRPERNCTVPIGSTLDLSVVGVSSLQSMMSIERGGARGMQQSPQLQQPGPAPLSARRASRRAG